MTIQAAIELTTGLDKCQKKADVDLRFAMRVSEIEIEHERKLREIETRTAAAQINAYKEALPSWYQEPWFVATVTAVLTIAATVGIFAIVAETQQAIVR